MTDIKVFYHIACINNWKDIVRDQITKIIFSGLYDKVSKIHCFLVGNPTDLELYQSLLSKYGKKIIIERIEENGDESLTLVNIKNFINSNTKFLYIHTKGVTRYNTNTLVIDDYIHKIENLYENVADWNNVMEYFLIKNHEICINKLDEFDIVGINYVGNENNARINKHFSGNFWWCNANYYMSLQEIMNYSECYIFNANPNHLSLFQTNLEGYRHYFHAYKMENYVDKNM
jgi:hypothetical protein